MTIPQELLREISKENDSKSITDSIIEHRHERRYYGKATKKQTYRINFRKKYSYGRISGTGGRT